jgi:quinol monooxygenase YgiN
MTQMFIRHKVNDYEVWKAAFDKFAAFRKSSGEKSYHIFHHQDDPNNLYLLFKWDNLENASKFIDSSDLKEAMRRAGVAEQPEIHFLTEVDKGAL